jgi:hypothetical protein
MLYAENSRMVFCSKLWLEWHHAEQDRQLLKFASMWLHSLILFTAGEQKGQKVHMLSSRREFISRLHNTEILHVWTEAWRAGAVLLGKIRYMSRRRRSSPMSLRSRAFPRSARSTPCAKSGSHAQRIRGYLAARPEILEPSSCSPPAVPGSLAQPHRVCRQR